MGVRVPPGAPRRKNQRVLVRLLRSVTTLYSILGDENFVIIFNSMLMEQEKTKSNQTWIVLIVVVAIVAGAYFVGKSADGGKKYKISFPFTHSVVSNTTFVCEALVDSSVTGSPVEYLTNGIEVTTGKGTNKVSLQIKDEKTLSLLSDASLNAGDVDDVDFSIVKNDDKELVATMWNGTSMHTIVLNKKNGLAIWSKSRSDFPTYEAPSADLSYLICR